MSDAPQWPQQYLFRLTVARRRRLASRVAPRLPELTHRLPVHEVRGDCGGSLALAERPVWVNDGTAAAYFFEF